MSGDGGIDLVLGKEGKKIPVQCKAHKAAIGAPLMRDFLGSIVIGGYDSGVMVALSGVTAGAAEIAKSHNISVVDVQSLIAMSES